jgi:hypothetical protein
MLIRRIALVLTLALGSTHAANADPNGMKLQEWCSNPKGSTESLECAVYMSGFLDGYGFSQDTAQKALCLPREGITVGQVRLITEKFMSEHPEELHKSAPAIIVRALHIAFACKRGDEAGR